MDDFKSPTNNSNPFKNQSFNQENLMLDNLKDEFRKTDHDSDFDNLEDLINQNGPSILEKQNS